MVASPRVAYLSGGVGWVFAGEDPKKGSVASRGVVSREVWKQVAVRGDYVLPLHTTALAGSSPEHPKSPPRRRLRHAPSLLSTTGCRASSRRAWESLPRFRYGLSSGSPLSRLRSRSTLSPSAKSRSIPWLTSLSETDGAGDATWTELLRV